MAKRRGAPTQDDDEPPTTRPTAKAKAQAKAEAQPKAEAKAKAKPAKPKAEAKPKADAKAKPTAPAIPKPQCDNATGMIQTTLQVHRVPFPVQDSCLRSVVCLFV